VGATLPALAQAGRGRSGRAEASTPSTRGARPPASGSTPGLVQGFAPRGRVPRLSGKCGFCGGFGTRDDPVGARWHPPGSGVTWDQPGRRRRFLASRRCDHEHDERNHEHCERDHRGNGQVPVGQCGARPAPYAACRWARCQAAVYSRQLAHSRFAGSSRSPPHSAQSPAARRAARCWERRAFRQIRQARWPLPLRTAVSASRWPRGQKSAMRRG
jgi:hypothetical protein